MALKEQFQQAINEVREIGKIDDQEDLLKLYGLYKQATEGDVNKSKPRMLDFKGKAKWESWSKNKGLSQEDAMMKYIAFTDELGQKYLKENSNATDQVNKVVHDALDSAFSKGF